MPDLKKILFVSTVCLSLLGGFLGAATAVSDETDLKIPVAAFERKESPLPSEKEEEAGYERLGKIKSSESVTKVIPGGEAFGVRFTTDGVTVVGTESFEDENGKTVAPAGDAGIRAGDLIVGAGGKEISSNEELIAAVTGSKGKSLRLTLKRGREEIKVNVTPVKNRAEEYKIGIWVKDSSSGIGTVTYWLEDGSFGGLGHGICDSESGELLPIKEATVWGVDIFGVKKSLRGQPGELRGIFRDDLPIGTLTENTLFGGFGKAAASAVPQKEAVEVADESEVTEGAVTILCTVNGRDIGAYSAEIVRVNRSSDNKSRNLLLRITDPVLLEATGGIVQGMSGSPILQNGKLVGAVTHVLVNQPDMGYGIFIDNMLSRGQESCSFPTAA